MATACRHSPVLNLAEARVTCGVNGPGRRFTVWVQGCPQRCRGCFNPGLRPFAVRRLVDPADLAHEAAACAPLDGVTLSGGEPFSQAAELSLFLDALRATPGLSNLTALAFTGRTVEELGAGPPEWGALLARLDLVVDGRYEQGLRADKPLRASANQRLVPLTAAGEALALQVAKEEAGGVEVTIADDGEVIVAGFPPPRLLRELRRALAPARGRPG